MGIPEAIKRAIDLGYCAPLPKRNGFFVMLNTTDDVGCPGCHRVMCFVILRQKIDLIDKPASRYTYTCVDCDEEEAVQV
jgi:hypothetical protein